MAKSSWLSEEPLVANVDHTNTTCAVEWTNFSARLNPAGMALLKGIDPTARFIERYYHTYGVNAIALRAGVVGKLNSLGGFAQLYQQVINENDTGSLAMAFAVTGFPYEIDVKHDSPLVGWFTVMKERD
jgi:hypothetical protein